MIFLLWITPSSDSARMRKKWIWVCNYMTLQNVKCICCQDQGTNYYTPTRLKLIIVHSKSMALHRICGFWVESSWSLHGIHGLHEDSMRTLWRLHEDSMRTLWGLHEDSMRTFRRLWGLHGDSMRTPQGLEDSTRTPWKPVGDCKIQVVLDHQLNNSSKLTHTCVTSSKTNPKSFPMASRYV